MIRDRERVITSGGSKATVGKGVQGVPVAQLEVISPEQKGAFARALLAAWLAKAGEP